MTGGLARHSQRKRGRTDRLRLRNTVPVLDPTVDRKLLQYQFDEFEVDPL